MPLLPLKSVWIVLIDLVTFASSRGKLGGSPGFVDIIPLNYDSCVSNESVPIIGAWMIEISLDMLMLERKFGHQEQLSTIHTLGMRNV
jgi:hypothetical protein